MSTYNIKNFSQGEKDNEEIGKYVLILIIIILLLGILRISWWSFEQTRYFFLPYDNQGIGSGNIDVTISYSLAILFQYGQNPAWFLILRHLKRFNLAKLQVERTENPSEGLITHYRNQRVLVIFWIFLFAICAIVDAGTNLIMINRIENIDVLSLWVMRIVAFAVVFVEEFFMKTLTVLVGLFKDVGTWSGFKKLFRSTSSKNREMWSEYEKDVSTISYKSDKSPKNHDTYYKLRFEDIQD